MTFKHTAGKHTPVRDRSGFTIVELAAVIAILTTLAALLGPAAGKMRSQARGITSESRLNTIGQASAMYSMDSQGAIATFNWQPGETYVDLRSGNSFVPSSQNDAAAYQARDILYRATGRLNGQFRILAPFSRLVHRRYSHLVLADYMGTVGQDLWADPNDYNQLIWQLAPTSYSFVPYGDGSPPFGYDSSFSWATSSIYQMWAFGSSYQTVPFAWMPDFAPTYAPLSQTPHLLTVAGSGGFSLGGREQTEVRFPSSKVFMFEEFDRERVGDPYFAYDYTTPAKLMFDGSINTMETARAKSAVSPDLYSFGSKRAWSQRYLPIDTFPLPMGGAGDQTELDMRYRWTLEGLQGVDYTRTLSRPRR
ncbi:MAG: type II secretion system protein [Phycisphaerales bacterium]